MHRVAWAAAKHYPEGGRIRHVEHEGDEQPPEHVGHDTAEYHHERTLGGKRPRVLEQANPDHYQRTSDDLHFSLLTSWTIHPDEVQGEHND